MDAGSANLAAPESTGFPVTSSFRRIAPSNPASTALSLRLACDLLTGKAVMPGSPKWSVSMRAVVTTQCRIRSRSQSLSLAAQAENARSDRLGPACPQGVVAEGRTSRGATGQC